MHHFSKSILKWYDKSHRSLPWRNTENPYHIWLSEIILQQTRVDQGLSYYDKFIEQFPTIVDLANADEQLVLKTWQGLGYYSRARNLHYTAQTIRDQFNGKFPSDYVEIRKLKGIGDYTAAAIASFAFKQPYAVVDGNVFRVLSRVFNIHDDILSAKAKTKFYNLAQALLDKNNPGNHNQAVMELGATVCTPHQPKCEECPVSMMCIAREKNLIRQLPFKKKKPKATQRYIEYFVLQNDQGLLLRKRGADDIWQNMYDFPSIELDDQLDPLIVRESEEWKKYFSRKKIGIEQISPTVRHVLSHQVIHARFWKIRYQGTFEFLNSEYVNVEELIRYPFPRLIDKYLEENI